MGRWYMYSLRNCEKRVGGAVSIRGPALPNHGMHPTPTHVFCLRKLLPFQYVGCFAARVMPAVSLRHDVA
jgi:hypothetical protein